MWTVLFILDSVFPLVSACLAISGQKLSVLLLCFEFDCNGISDMDYFCDSSNYLSLVDVIQMKYFDRLD